MMGICILIIGSVLLIGATLLMTVFIKSTDDDIDNLHQKISSLQNKGEQFSSILLKQGQTSILEELYALQANDMIYRDEQSKANDFIKLVLEQGARSAGQWASASMSENVIEFEKETQNKINNIVSDQTTDFVQKRGLIDQLHNDNLNTALKNFSEIQSQLSKAKTDIAAKESRKKLQYSFYVWMQIFGLIILVFGDGLEKLSKTT